MPSLRTTLASGLLVAGLAAASGLGLGQQGQPQAPEVTVYKTPT